VEPIVALVDDLEACDANGRPVAVAGHLRSSTERSTAADRHQIGPTRTLIRRSRVRTCNF